MTNVPLIQGNTAQEINTSIIAIKKAQKELELLNRQVDEKIKALNFALIGGDGKYIQSIEQSAGLIKAIEGNISDSVASGDSNPVTSGGVYTALQEYNPVDTIAYGNNKAVTSNAVANVLCYSTSGRSLTGPTLQSGIIIRVMFTAQQTGSNTSTAFTITYNGTAYTVKAPKNGALSNFVASNVSGSYIYCQAYTTLEMMFDGTQFVIIGNPVVISNADYTIYTDGKRINNSYKLITSKLDSSASYTFKVNYDAYQEFLVELGSNHLLQEFLCFAIIPVNRMRYNNEFRNILTTYAVNDYWMRIICEPHSSYVNITCTSNYPLAAYAIYGK